MKLVSASGMSSYASSNEIRPPKISESLCMRRPAQQSESRQRPYGSPCNRLCRPSSQYDFTAIIRHRKGVMQYERSFDSWWKRIPVPISAGDRKVSLDKTAEVIERGNVEIVTLALRRANLGGDSNILNYRLPITLPCFPIPPALATPRKRCGLLGWLRN